MIKTLKKIVFSLFSIFGISILFWVIFLMNPSLSYAHQTTFDKITVYHNQELAPETAEILAMAYEKIKFSELFDSNLQIQLCMNDGTYYPNLHPFAGALAYSFLNKSVIYRSTPNFKENRASFAWEENGGETRYYDLVELLAHEFTHNLQGEKDWAHNFKYEIWKIEGYAEYVARQERLKSKSLKEHIDVLLKEEANTQIGVPRVLLEDGTGWTLSYYRYCLLIKYLIEEKGMTYPQILDSSFSMEEVGQEMEDFARQ